MDHLIIGREGIDSDRNVARINFTVVCALLAWIIVIILSIELAIRWNHISGAYILNDIGQWTILLAAICSVVRVLWVWQELERLPEDA